LVGWAARSGRFLFHKDTSCRLGPIRAKIDAARGTPFRFLNAHTPTLLPSLQAGGAGYCGTAANVYPGLLAWLCARHTTEPGRAERLQTLLGVMDRAVAHKYPTSAKAYLASLGLPITTFCRARPTPLEEPDETVLAHLRALVAALENEYADSLPV
jgi:4-hydroxy-tetrahydrodipicolinate synthase